MNLQQFLIEISEYKTGVNDVINPYIRCKKISDKGLVIVGNDIKRYGKSLDQLMLNFS